MDSIAPIGDIQTTLNSTGGWADEPAVTIANDVMQELISLRFPWKWNRMKLTPFPLIPLQQDYATVNVRNIGWLEDALRIDINNSMYPPPTWTIYVVRDLPMERQLGGFPFQVAWHFNRELEPGEWPGPNYTFTWPLGVAEPPDNRACFIQDALGNLLTLTQFGTTGTEPPIAPPWETSITQPPGWPIGQTVIDGSCIWTVCNPDAQGFRFRPIPPQGGNVWLIRLWAQKKAPVISKVTQKLDPVPDDEIKFFRDGCIAYACRYSSNPGVKAQFPMKRQEWIQAMQQATVKNNREEEAHGFFPDRAVASPSYVTDPGPYPYRYGWR
jgi:hypothetical protein